MAGHNGNEREPLHHQKLVEWMQIWTYGTEAAIGGRGGAYGAAGRAGALPVAGRTTLDVRVPCPRARAYRCACCVRLLHCSQHSRALSGCMRVNADAVTPSRRLTHGSFESRRSCSASDARYKWHFHRGRRRWPCSSRRRAWRSGDASLQWSGAVVRGWVGAGRRGRMGRNVPPMGLAGSELSQCLASSKSRTGSPGSLPTSQPALRLYSSTRQRHGRPPRWLAIAPRRRTQTGRRRLWCTIDHSRPAPRLLHSVAREWAGAASLP
eukprot:SAG11_NODE_1334_length_5178_cov_10.938374_5_plen_266_part_00